MPAFLIWLKQFFLLTNLTEILRQKTSVQNFVKSMHAFGHTHTKGFSLSLSRRISFGYAIILDPSKFKYCCQGGIQEIKTTILIGSPLLDEYVKVSSASKYRACCIQVVSIDCKIG